MRRTSRRIPRDSIFDVAPRLQLLRDRIVDRRQIANVVGGIAKLHRAQRPLVPMREGRPLTKLAPQISSTSRDKAIGYESPANPAAICVSKRFAGDLPM